MSKICPKCFFVPDSFSSKKIMFFVEKSVNRSFLCLSHFYKRPLFCISLSLNIVQYPDVVCLGWWMSCNNLNESLFSWVFKRGLILFLLNYLPKIILHLSFMLVMILSRHYLVYRQWLTVDVDGYLFLGWRQAALFITPAKCWSKYTTYSSMGSTSLLSKYTTPIDHFCSPANILTVRIL